MKVYRVFSNDRSEKLFSGLMEVKAKTAGDALRIVKAKNPPIRRPWGVEEYHAVQWPVTLEADKGWMRKHVGIGGGR